MPSTAVFLRKFARTACRRRLFVGLIATLAASTLLATTAIAQHTFPEARHEGGELKYINELPVVVLAGTSEEIGRQHAALLGEPDSAIMQFPKKFVGQLGLDFLWPLAVHASKVLLQQAPQRYQREMAAAGEDANFDSDAAGVANTLLELRRVGCSTLIVEPRRSTTGGPLFGRNLDFPTLGLLDQYSLVMVYKPTGFHAFAAIGFPGFVGVLSGMNDAGLAVATLDVYDAADGSTRFDATGVPLAFVFRQILEQCETVDQAEQLLSETKATTYMNLAVCDRDRGAVFEITPKTIARRDAEDAILPCTNHFRTPHLAVDDSCWRFERLCAAATHRRLGIESIRRHLHSANQGELTLQTMVFEPRELTIHLAIGKPPTSGRPLKRIELAPLFASGPLPVATQIDP